MHERLGTNGHKVTISSYIALVVAGVALFFSNLHRLSLGVLGESIIAEYGLTDSQFGMLGAAIFYSYGLLQIPSGVIADMVPAKKLITFSSFATGVAALLFANASSFESLVIARVLTGIGTSFIYVPGLALIRREFGDKNYASMVGIFGVMGGLGGIFSSTPLRLLADRFHWTLLFKVFAAISIVMSIVSWFAIKEHSAIVSGKQKKRIGNVRDVLSMGALSVTLWFMLVSGTRLGFQSVWAGRFFRQSLGTDPTGASFCLMMLSVGGLFGTVILGRMADRFGSVKMLTAGTLILAATWVVLALMPHGSPLALIMAVCLINGVFASTSTVGYGCVRLFVPTESTGFATGINNAIIFAGGILFTQAGSSLMDMTGSDDPTVRYSLLMWSFVVTAVFCAAAVLIINRRRINE